MKFCLTYLEKNRKKLLFTNYIHIILCLPRYENVKNIFASKQLVKINDIQLKKNLEQMKYKKLVIYLFTYGAKLKQRKMFERKLKIKTFTISKCFIQQNVLFKFLFEYDFFTLFFFNLNAMSD